MPLVCLSYHQQASEVDSQMSELLACVWTHHKRLFKVICTFSSISNLIFEIKYLVDLLSHVVFCRERLSGTLYQASWCGSNWCRALQAAFYLGSNWSRYSVVPQSGSSPMFTLSRTMQLSLDLTGPKLCYKPISTDPAGLELGSKAFIPHPDAVRFLAHAQLHSQDIGPDSTRPELCSESQLV